MEIEKRKIDVGMIWKTVKLEKLCKMNSGGTPSRGIKEYYSGDIPWAKISDIEAADGGVVYSTEEHITKDGLNAINNRIFEKGTLLLAMYGSVGKVAFTGVDMSTNQAILGIRIIDETVLDYSYLKYWFQTIKSKLLDRAVGGTLQNISLGIVKDLEIPLPPLATQKRIAEILDAADAIRRKDQELLKKYDELAQAIFIDMFGDPVKNEKGWEVRNLDEVCTKITDGTHFSPPNVEVGIPYITAKHLKKDRVDFNLNPTYISQEDHEEIYKRCSPIKGDVLYIKDGATTGMAAVNEYDFEFSMLSSLALIKPNTSSLNPYYLATYLNNSIVKEELIREFMAGAAIKRFTLDKIKRFKIYLPSIVLQNKFQSTYELMRLNAGCVATENGMDLFNVLIQKAFKGELVK